MEQPGKAGVLELFPDMRNILEMGLAWLALSLTPVTQLCSAGAEAEWQL